MRRSDSHQELEAQFTIYASAAEHSGSAGRCIKQEEELGLACLNLAQVAEEIASHTQGTGKGDVADHENLAGGIDGQIDIRAERGRRGVGIVERRTRSN